ncbi:MAG: hypothetical protein AAGD25_36320 [Cyanobacteria bacterium P01_F01_bin.150]
MSFKSVLFAALVPFAALGAAAGFTSPAQAHNVETNYILSGQNELEIQVMYSTGEPFESAPVKIYSPNDPENPVLEGTTDATGRFAFAADTEAEAGEWKMKIGELGHADILHVPVDENGIDIEQVSRHDPASDSHNHYWAVGVAMISLGIGAKALHSRMQYQANMKMLDGDRHSG